jgi:hypothetical protein
MILLVSKARQAIPLLNIEFFINAKSMGKAIGRNLMNGMSYKAADFEDIDILFDYDELSHFTISDSRGEVGDADDHASGTSTYVPGGSANQGGWD